MLKYTLKYYSKTNRFNDISLGDLENAEKYILVPNKDKRINK